MPHLGDIPEEAEAREFGVDNALDDATCCVPGRGEILPEFWILCRNFVDEVGRKTSGKTRRYRK